MGTLAVCRKTRLSEEVLAEAVERHFKSFHQVPHGIAEDVFHKWASKMASAIVRMSVRFKHLHTVSKTSKSKTLSKMKLDLDTRLAVQSLSASKEDNTDSILEADPLPIVEEQDVRLEALGTLLAAATKRAQEKHTAESCESTGTLASDKKVQAEQALQKLSLPPEAGCIFCDVANFKMLGLNGNPYLSALLLGRCCVPSPASMVVSSRLPSSL